jgi:hypothetical protein
MTGRRRHRADRAGPGPGSVARPDGVSAVEIAHRGRIPPCLPAAVCRRVGMAVAHDSGKSELSCTTSARICVPAIPRRSRGDDAPRCGARAAVRRLGLAFRNQVSANKGTVRPARRRGVVLVPNGIISAGRCSRVKRLCIFRHWLRRDIIPPPHWRGAADNIDRSAIIHSNSHFGARAAA